MLLKARHRCLDRRCFTGNDRHFGRVLVRCDHVTFRGLKNSFHDFVRSGDTGHQAFVIDFNGAHFRSASSSSTKGAVHVEDAGGHQGRIFAKGMPGHHVGSMAEGAERALNGQISREHGRLRVFSLLELVLCFLEFLLGQRGAENESREGFATQHIHHGLVGLSPDLCWGGESLDQVRRHANVLAALSGIHVDGFRFGWHGGLIGDKYALGLQEPPLRCVKHGLTCQPLPLCKFSPGGRHQGHPEGRLSIE